ncbi:hypothetical protein [Bacillus phage BSTP8]|nr:AbrB family transcriptional regulator [Bacillus phage BSTP5]QRI44321.1 hypothetical protein [Bacillus phage BSTP8]QRI44447.1 AbrB family transcriptional regulator [Bacillus phage BSTP10]QRI44495.1 hypothetical protein [Bacillus phage BSTP12]
MCELIYNRCSRCEGIAQEYLDGTDEYICYHCLEELESENELMKKEREREFRSSRF